MTRSQVHCDVLVAGAGPAGLAVTGLLGDAGVSTVLAGPAGASAGDTRTTALFAGAEVLLRRIGAADALADHRTPLKALRIIDRIERDDIPSRILFEAAEIGLDAFGANYRNTELVAALEACCKGFPSVERRCDAIVGYERGSEGIAATLEDGSEVHARLVIAADGRGSPARQAAGISARDWDYGQTALAFQIRHSASHDNISTEIHRPGGPLTIIPLPDRHSAINWLVQPDRGEWLAGLPDGEFLSALDEELGGLLGTLETFGRRGSFPVRGLSVGALAASRTALIGEAGHVLPPIGAQGLNLGFRDAAVISDLAARAIGDGRDPGGDDVLSAYVAARRTDIVSRRAATDLLNRSLLLGGRAVSGFRGLGLTLLAASGHARRAMMREGLVRTDDLPRLMREEAGPTREAR